MQRSSGLGKARLPRSEKLGKEVLRLPDRVIDVVAIQGGKDRTLHRVWQLVFQELAYHLGDFSRLSFGKVSFFNEGPNHFFHAGMESRLALRTNQACDLRRGC